MKNKKNFSRNKKSASEIKAFFLSKQTDNHENILQVKMQWAAFLSANVLRFYDRAKIEIMSLLAEEKKSISLSYLLEDNEQNLSFKKGFKEELKLYINWVREIKMNCLERNGTRPDTSEDTPPIGIFSIQRIQEEGIDKEVERFLNEIKNVDSIELFFPKRLKFLPTYTMSSTAHPLNDAPENYGFIRFSVTENCQTNFSSSQYVETVDREHVRNHSNVIVARPCRKEQKEDCLYEAYENINFENYLND